MQLACCTNKASSEPFPIRLCGTAVQNEEDWQFSSRLQYIIKPAARRSLQKWRSRCIHRLARPSAPAWPSRLSRTTRCCLSNRHDIATFAPVSGVVSGPRVVLTITFWLARRRGTCRAVSRSLKSSRRHQGMQVRCCPHPVCSLRHMADLFGCFTG